MTYLTHVKINGTCKPQNNLIKRPTAIKMADFPEMNYNSIMKCTQL